MNLIIKKCILDEISSLPTRELKYAVIESKSQYREYCLILESLDEIKSPNSETKKEIKLLTLLIEKWDEDHNTFSDVDPVIMIKSLMQEKDIRAQDLANASGLSKGLISDILNYRKAMSKEMIRFLAAYFKLSQEALNVDYKLNQRKRLKSKARQT